MHRPEPGLASHSGQSHSWTRSVRFVPTMYGASTGRSITNDGVNVLGAVYDVSRPSAFLPITVTVVRSTVVGEGPSVREGRVALSRDPRRFRAAPDGACGRARTRLRRRVVLRRLGEEVRSLEIEVRRIVHVERHDARAKSAVSVVELPHRSTICLATAADGMRLSMPPSPSSERSTMHTRPDWYISP